jgi:hypothetical protein
MCDRELRQHIDGTFSALFTLLALDDLRFGGSYQSTKVGPNRLDNSFHFSVPASKSPESQISPLFSNSNQLQDTSFNNHSNQQTTAMLNLLRAEDVSVKAHALILYRGRAIPESSWAQPIISWQGYPTEQLGPTDNIV